MEDRPQLIHICAWCQREMRDGNPIGESMVNPAESDNKVSHGICLECKPSMIHTTRRFTWSTSRS